MLLARACGRGRNMTGFWVGAAPIRTPCPGLLTPVLPEERFPYDGERGGVSAFRSFHELLKAS